MRLSMISPREPLPLISRQPHERVTMIRLAPRTTAIIRSTGLAAAAALTAAAAVAVMTAPAADAATGATAAISPGRAVGATSLGSLRIVLEASGVMLENSHSVKCLSSDGRDDHDAEQFGCAGGDANQLWVRGSDFSGSGSFQWVNQGTHQCLGVSGSSKSKGATVVVFKCSTGHLSQYWSTGSDGPVEGVDFTNLNSGDCLQIAGDSTASGAIADQEPFDDLGSPNQIWNRGSF
jgi:hypothetical protein